MNLDSRIGETAGPYTEEVTQAKVDAFARAVGAEPGAVPPTYVTRCRKGEFELFGKLGIPLSRVLHGEQAYEYVAPIRVGDTITYETSLARSVEKSGSSGSMTFIVFETRIQGSDGKERAVSCTTIVVKGEGKS